MKQQESKNYQACSLNEIQNTMLYMLVDIDRVCRKYGIEYWLSDGTLLGAIRHNGFIPWDDDVDISMTYSSFLKFMQVAPNELGKKYFIQNYETDSEYDIVGVYTKIRDKNSIFIEEWDKEYQQGAFIDIFIMNQFNENDLFYKIKKEYYRILSLSLQPLSVQDSRFKKIIKKILRVVFFYYDNRKMIHKGHKADVKHKQEGTHYSYSFSTPMSVKYRYHKEDIFPLKDHDFEGHMFLVPKNYEKILTTIYANYMEIPSEDKRIGHALFYSLEKQGDKDE